MLPVTKRLLTAVGVPTTAVTRTKAARLDAGFGPLDGLSYARLCNKYGVTCGDYGLRPAVEVVVWAQHPMVDTILYHNDALCMAVDTLTDLQFLAAGVK